MCNSMIKLKLQLHLITDCLDSLHNTQNPPLHVEYTLSNKLAWLWDVLQDNLVKRQVFGRLTVGTEQLSVYQSLNFNCCSTVDPGLSKHAAHNRVKLCVCLCVCNICRSALSTDLRKYLWFCLHTKWVIRPGRGYVQDVELTLGQHESGLSRRETAVTQQAATWVGADTACRGEHTGPVKPSLLS